MKMTELSQQCLATSVKATIAVFAGAAALAFSIMPGSVTAASGDHGSDRATPTKHVITIVGTVAIRFSARTRSIR